MGTREAPRRYRSFDTVLEQAEPVTLDPAELLLVAGEEPNTFEEAEPHATWRAAMLDELQSIEENETWTLTMLPAGK